MANPNQNKFGKIQIKSMVRDYLEKINELNTIDEKVHNILTKIKKSHENDNIFKKI